MAKQGFKVMDSDMHVMEPADLWQTYMEPAFKDRAPVGKSRFKRDLGVTVEGREVETAVSPQFQAGRRSEREVRDPNYTDGEGSGWDAGSQVRAMDVEGIDIAVLFPSRGLNVLGLSGIDPKLAAAICRAYNSWLYDFCSEHPDRLYGAGMVAPHDVELAVSETRRCVEELGFRGIFIRPNLVNGINWHDAHYDPLWAECQRLGVPVEWHESGNPPTISQVGDQFETSMLHHACAHPLGMMLAVASACGGGILERFPELKFAFLEANCAWVPWLMWRLDEHYEWRGYEHPDLTMPPSAYFKRQCFASIEPDEWPAKYVDDLGYGDGIVFSTDYPHPDSRYPHSIDRFLEMDMSDGTKRKYLWDNCVRLYGFSGDSE